VLWVLVARLARAFVTTDLTLAYVAEHSRRGQSLAYRVAGVWGGMEGSLLLFAAIMATAAALAVRRAARPWFAAAAATLLGATALVTAWPFHRLAAPALEGFGLDPILLHPAMVVHPPLLYAGLAATLPAFASTRHTRRWMLGALAVLTAAMTLGALWSYVEQGWGGYWAWDPVENASLATWLAVLVALHARGDTTSRRTAILHRLPFVVALGGSAVSRAGLAGSVHAFADVERVGWALAALMVVAAVAATTDVRRRPPASRLDRWPLVQVVLTAAALVVVTVLTIAPLLLADDRAGARVGGTYFARLLAPFAWVGAAALVVLAVRQRRRVHGAAWIAHVGMLVLLLGVGGSTFDREQVTEVPSGAAARVAGVLVVNRGIELADGPTPGSQQVTALLEVNGVAARPALVSYPERGGVLAETALVTRPWRDVQVLLRSARDDGRVLVEVRTKPLVELIWLGAVLVTAGAIVSARRRPGRDRHPHVEPASSTAIPPSTDVEQLPASASPASEAPVSTSPGSTSTVSEAESTVSPHPDPSAADAVPPR
jgi:cytochrome c-type biogenesis protein NrfE